MKKQVLLAVLGAAFSALPLSAADAQLPGGYCLNMPADGTVGNDEFGCETGHPYPDPRDVGNYGNRSHATDTANAGDSSAELIEAAILAAN